VTLKTRVMKLNIQLYHRRPNNIHIENRKKQTNKKITKLLFLLFFIK